MASKLLKPLSRRSTFQRMLALLLLVLLGQMLIYFVAFFFSGALDETERNAFYILSERTANRRLDLERDMVSRWSGLDDCETQVLRSVDLVMQNYSVSAEQLLENAELCQKVVSTAAADIMAALRRCGVTGAFLVLNCADNQGGYPGFYIRDYDPIGFSENNTDLLIERGLPEISRKLNISMDGYWSARFRFDIQPEGSSEFFFKPLNAALAAPQEAAANPTAFGYWSGQYLLSSADRPVTAYSFPLVWEDGTVLGVLGVDLTADYLAEQLPYDELGEGRSGAYFLGITRDGGASYELVCSSGPNFRAYFGKSSVLTTAANKHEGVVVMQGTGLYAEKRIYGTPQPLRLYNSGSPFEGEQWALIGVMSEEHLLSYSKELRVLMLLAAALSLVFGLVLIFLAARSFTRPLSKLMTALRESDPDQPIRLPRTSLGEVDSLSDAIETLSNAAAESASRISKIIAMSHIPIGVFEYRLDTNRVFCSRSLFELLDWPERPNSDAYLPSTEFFRRIKSVTGLNREGGEGQIFSLPRSGMRERWVQFFCQTEGDGTLGAFLDVTADMETKRRMEYERDYDILTGLYNRRAFDEHCERLFLNEGELKTAALLMLDLDNLKYVNDTYGHDYGDRYIQSFAQSLSYFTRFNAVMGRRSGDEFNVLLYGFGTQDQIREVTKHFSLLLEQSSVPLPGGECIRVRASGGIAWYQQDSVIFSELLRLADFAMYTVKHTVKGAVQEFSQEEYNRRSILIQGQDALNQFLDRRMVRYAVQSIVSAKDGTVYGYEFLMRPQHPQLMDLGSLMMLAKSQSKLRQIEELTWFEALKTYSQLVRDGRISPEAHAFINSVGNQRMTDENLQQLESLYGNLLHHVVAEITEGEEANPTLSAHKKALVEKWQAQLALDDFGTGYNSETVLIQISPNIVKVDMSIIRDIHIDNDRQALFQNLVRYAKSRGILVLAEGVETFQELETLIASGADFLQGYYLDCPSFDPQPIPVQRVEEIRQLRHKYHGDI